MIYYFGLHYNLFCSARSRCILLSTQTVRLLSTQSAHLLSMRYGPARIRRLLLPILFFGYFPHFSYHLGTLKRRFAASESSGQFWKCFLPFRHLWLAPLPMFWVISGTTDLAPFGLCWRVHQLQVGLAWRSRKSVQGRSLLDIWNHGFQLPILFTCSLLWKSPRLLFAWLWRLRALS